MGIPIEDSWELLSFESGLPQTPLFRSVDDGVMGGLSTSNTSYNPTDKCMDFHGEVSTRNNGGFASVRSRPREWGLDGSSGLSLLCKGDGKTYKMCAKMDDAWDSITWQLDFKPGPNFQEVRLPWDSFRPSWRGQVVRGAPRLEGSKVRQLGLMVSKFADDGSITAGFGPGLFRLGVRSMRALR